MLTTLLIVVPLAAALLVWILPLSAESTAGLALLEGTCPMDAHAYPYVHLVRGVLLEELGRVEDARASLSVARDRARNSHEAAQIDARLQRLGKRADV